MSPEQERPTCKAELNRQKDIGRYCYRWRFGDLMDTESQVQPVEEKATQGQLWHESQVFESLVRFGLMFGAIECFDVPLRIFDRPRDCLLCAHYIDVQD